jgi:hypothetical protein
MGRIMGAKRRALSVSICAAACASAGLVATAPVQAATPLHCGPAAFSGNVLRGPDSDLSIVGKLSVTVRADGSLTGALRNAGRTVRVTGTVMGRSVRLVFHLHGGLETSGSGVASKPIKTCAAFPRRGTLHGPRSGDSGRWGYALGG